MKTSVAYALATFAFFQLLFSVSPFPAFAGEHSSAAKTSSLEDEINLQTDTLAPPLMGAASESPFGRGEGLSLLSPTLEPGYWGNLNYELVGEKSFRLQSRGLKSSAGFFWLFDKPMDLRDRWMEIVYSGIAVPKQVLLRLDSRVPTSDGGFIVPLKNSFEPKSGYFKLPDRQPFSKITKLSFAFDPRFGKDVEMIILDLKVLPEGFDPLKGNDTAA